MPYCHNCDHGGDLYKFSVVGSRGQLRCPKCGSYDVME